MVLLKKKLLRRLRLMRTCPKLQCSQVGNMRCHHPLSITHNPSYPARPCGVSGRLPTMYTT